MSIIQPAGPLIGGAHPLRPSLSTVERGVFGLAAVVLLAALIARIIAADAEMLWLDELYTTTLIGTDSLFHLWQGVIGGLDGNPPLYMTLGWLLTQSGLSAEPALRAVNLLLTAGTAIILYRACRRLGNPAASMLALLLIAGTERIPAYVALELRTYALYLAAVSATLLLAQRLSERPERAGRCWSLAAVGGIATLSHTFGGFYVLAIGGALVLVAVIRGDRRMLRRSLAALLPAVCLLAFWLPLCLPALAAVSTPYGWLQPPGVTDLLTGLTGSFVLSVLMLASMLALAVGRRATLTGVRAWLADPDKPVVMGVALAGFAGLTVALWVASHVMTPAFSLRYFVPNLAIAAALATGFFAWMQSRVRPRLLLLLPLAFLPGALHAIATERGGEIPCLARDGSFLEHPTATGALPVILESTHSWLPRHTYGLGYQTIYPLDWEVVLNYSDKGRNNATDYNLMRILRDWVQPDDRKRDELLTTEQILARYPSFLVVHESWLSWFDHLRATQPLGATLLKEENGCSLWRVDQSAGPPS